MNLVWIPFIVAGAMIGFIVIRSRWTARRRLRRLRLRYAVLGAYMTGNRIATAMAGALELDIRDVYIALADLESRDWLTGVLTLPERKPNDNRSPAVTATRETYDGIRALHQIPDPGKEDDDA